MKSKMKIGGIIIFSMSIIVPLFSVNAQDDYQRPMQIEMPQRELPTEPDPALMVKDVMLPLLIKEVKMEAKDRLISGSFVLENYTNEIFSNASWRVEVYKGKLFEPRWDNIHMVPIGLQYVFVNQPHFTLQPKEKANQNYSLNLSPYLPAGEYTLKIIATRRDSGSFGSWEESLKLEQNKNGYLEINEKSVELVDLIGKKAYPAQYGWRIASELDKPQAQLLIKNPSFESVNTTPYFTIWERSFEKNKKSRELKLDNLSLAPNEEKKYVFDIPTDLMPGAYHAELDFKDHQGDLQAPPQIFHWVLGGNSGTLESLKINSDAYRENELIKLSVDAFGRADGIKDEYTVEGKVLDTKGSVILDEKVPISRPSNNNSFTVNFPEVKAATNLVVSRAEAFIYSKDGKLLDIINIEIKPLSQKSQDIVKSKNKLAKIPYLIFSAITAGIILMVLAYYFKKRNSVSMRIILILLSFIVLILFFGGKANAHWVCDSNYDGCWLPGQCDPAHPFCGAIFTTCANAEGGFSSYPASISINEPFVVTGNAGGGVWSTPCNNPYSGWGAHAWYAPPGSGWIDLGEVGGSWAFSVPGSATTGTMQVWVRGWTAGWGCSAQPFAYDEHDFVINVAVICTDTTWSPDPSTICAGTPFTQTSNCGNTRSATGTKSCVTFAPTLNPLPASGTYPPGVNSHLTTTISGTDPGPFTYSNHGCGGGAISNVSNGNFDCSYSAVGTYITSIKVTTPANPTGVTATKGINVDACAGPSYSCSTQSGDCTGKCGQMITGTATCSLTNCDGSPVLPAPTPADCVAHGVSCTAPQTQCPPCTNPSGSNWKETAP